MFFLCFEINNQTFKKICLFWDNIDYGIFINNFENINQIFKKIYPLLGEVDNKWIFYSFKISTKFLKKSTLLQVEGLQLRFYNKCHKNLPRLSLDNYNLELRFKVIKIYRISATILRI